MGARQAAGRHAPSAQRPSAPAASRPAQRNAADQTGSAQPRAGHGLRIPPAPSSRSDSGAPDSGPTRTACEQQHLPLVDARSVCSSSYFPTWPGYMPTSEARMAACSMRSSSSSIDMRIAASIAKLCSTSRSSVGALGRRAPLATRRASGRCEKDAHEERTEAGVPAARRFGLLPPPPLVVVYEVVRTEPSVPRTVRVTCTVAPAGPSKSSKPSKPPPSPPPKLRPDPRRRPGRSSSRRPLPLPPKPEANGSRPPKKLRKMASASRNEKPPERTPPLPSRRGA